MKRLIEFLEANQRVDEDWKSSLGKAATIGALATGVAQANTDIQPSKGFDVRYGAKTPTEFHTRLSHKIDADDFNYKVNKLPDHIQFVQADNDSMDIEITIEKILSTPDSILSKYGKTNTRTIASAIVKACRKYDVDVNVLMAMLSSETGFNQNAKSWTGVKSIAQITADTFNTLQSKKRIDADHDLNGVFTDVTKAIYAAANILDYMSTHMHGNLEMIFAEYNGGATGGASPYRMYRQGVSKDKIIAWMRENKCSQRVIDHFFDETIPYVKKCMKAYHHYLDFDMHYED